MAGWTDYITDWSSADKLRLCSLTDALGALTAAVNERSKAVAISELKELSPLKTLLPYAQAIHNRVRALIPLYIDYSEIDPESFSTIWQSEEVKNWVEADLFTYLELEDCGFPSLLEMLSAEWVWQQYQILNCLKYTKVTTRIAISSQAYQKDLYCGYDDNNSWDIDGQYTDGVGYTNFMHMTGGGSDAGNEPIINALYNNHTLIKYSPFGGLANEFSQSCGFLDLGNHIRTARLYHSKLIWTIKNQTSLSFAEKFTLALKSTSGTRDNQETIELNLEPDTQLEYEFTTGIEDLFTLSTAQNYTIAELWKFDMPTNLDRYGIKVYEFEFSD